MIEKREGIRDLDHLRDIVRSRMDQRRYEHTLGVERMADSIGQIYLPDRISDLRTAALLHDITKCETLEKQLKYCSEFDIMICDADIASPAVLHGITAAGLIKREFPECSADVVDAVRWHTTGREGMTVFEGIIFLADYIEEGRLYDSCVKVREFFFGTDFVSMCDDDRLRHFYKALVMSAEFTLSSLEKRGLAVHPDTVKFRDYALHILRERNPGQI